jgi:hypothetical protein
MTTRSTGKDHPPKVDVEQEWQLIAATPALRVTVCQVGSTGDACARQSLYLTVRA